MFVKICFLIMFLGWLSNISYVPRSSTYVPQFFADEHLSVSYSACGVDTNWYTDIGATYHITSELTTKEKCTGMEKIQTDSGSGMGIDYIGNSILHTPTLDIYLNKVLYVPGTHKNLISIHHLTTDNPIFIEYHSHYFLVKGPGYEEGSSLRQM
jgi:hypothetical protein